jgi:hypothetical protein
MYRVVAKAFAFGAASRAAMLAAWTAFAAFASRTWKSAAALSAELYSETEVRARWLRGRASRLPRPVVRLTVVSTALVLTLAALALPDRSDGRMLASVELVLGSGAAVTASTAADEILIEFPVQTDAAAVPESAEQMTAAVSAMPQAAPQTQAKPQTKEPNLAGLAEIPEELMVDHPQPKKGKNRRTASFAAFSAAREKLPWGAVEPVAFAPMGPGQQQNQPGAVSSAASPAPFKISGAQIGKWMKGKATKIKGAERTKPLYHFVIWVEPPEALQGRVSGVSYDFSSPAVQPQSQASSDRTSGFKINAAGLACSDKITVTLRFDDGRVEKTNIDGCELFNKA